MLDRRTLLWLGGGGAVTLAGALLLGPGSPSAPPPRAGVLALPDLAGRLARAARLELRKSDSTLVLTRDGQRWLLPDKGNYPVRAEKVREILVGLTELRLVEPRTAERDQLTQLGLDDPMNTGSTAVLLRVLDAGNAVLAELILGRRRVRTQGNLPESIYVRRPGETQAWLAEGRLAVDTDPQLWVDRDLGNVSAERLRKVTIRRSGQQPIVLSRGGEAGAKLRFAEPANPPSQDEVALDEVSRAFEFLTFLDVKPAAEPLGEALGEARFEYTDELVVTAWPARAGDTLWVKLRAEGGADGPRLNAAWQGWQFQLGMWKEKALTPLLEELMERPAPPPAGTPEPALAPIPRPASRR